MKKIYFLFTIFSLSLSLNMLSADIYVSAAGDDTTGDGSSGSPFLTIGKAVIEATSGDNIFIVGTVVQTGEVTLNKNLTFQGQSSAIITGNGSNRLFVVSGGSLTVSFSDIIFKDIASQDPSPGSSVATDYAGGVLFNSQSNFNLTITDCVFSGNSSTSTSGGGALYLSGGGTTTATITNTTFYNNQILSATTGEARGGAIIVYNATVNLTNCTFFENKLARTGNFHGAAIRGSSSGATVTATNCLFYNNKSNGGSGDNSDFNAVPGATMTMINCLAQYQNNIDTQTNTTITNSDFLSASNISWNATENRVEFTAPDNVSDPTPIDFGNNTSDIGAWDSKINIFKGGATGAVESWAELTNWSNGALPTATDNVAILTGGASTLNTNATINNIKVTGRLDIKNDQSLIVSGDATGSGTINYLRDLTDNADLSLAWHLVSSPLNDEIFDGTFVTENDITANGDNRGIASYTSSSNSWSYFNTVSNTSITATRGKGFSMKITPDGVTAGERADNVVEFSGSFNTADVLTGVVTDGDGFNLIGNPYTSNINSATFLTDNTGSLVSQTIWVWDSAAGNYDTYVTGDSFVLAPAQGFFVRASASTDLTFAESNQSETGGTFQKASRTEIKLLMNDGTANRFAKIYYLPNATTGFDNGYDGETFGGIPNSLSVFTQLVEENQGKKYQIQSLPISDIESIIIPVGIISDAGKELTFSLETTNFPSGVKIYLEDRLNNTFNEISNGKSFKVTLTEASNDVGRFYLYTSSTALSTDNISFESVSIYTLNESTLKMIGLPSGESRVKIYNILGKQVLNTSFISSGAKELALPKLVKGVYIVELENRSRTLNKKIILE